MNHIESFINNDKRTYAIISQRGDYDCDFQNMDSTSHFIITAILIDENNFNCMQSKVNEVLDNLLYKTSIKRIDQTSNYESRVNLLNSIKDIDFKVFSVIIDKKKMFENNLLNHRISFVNFVNGLIYNELHSYFPKLQIVLDEDENESNEFMNEFKKYVFKNHIPNLLGEYELGFENKKITSLLDLSNFICDTITFNYGEKYNLYEINEYVNILQNKLIPTVIWPQRLDDYIKKISQYNSSDYDENIACSSVSLAVKFIKNNRNSIFIEMQEQVYVLKYLLSMLISQKSNAYISSKDIINNLSEVTGREYTSHYFKTKIIAKLRDAGVIISSTQSGYKIPIKKDEIMAFVNQTSSMIKPMLQRLNICRDRVLESTENKVDILDGKQYKYLKVFYDM